MISPKKLFLSLMALTGLITAAMWLINCNGCDKPNEPKQPKEYLFYFSDISYSPQLFTLHPTTGQIDSVSIPWRATEGITASADGKVLYLATNDDVKVINATTYQLVATLPYESDRAVSVSPDNRLVAITGDDLHILRTSDYSVFYSDTDQTEHGYFSYDSKTYYCAAGWGSGAPGVLYSVNLSNDQFPVSRKVLDGGLVRVVPYSDNTKLFLYLNYGNPVWSFEVYDILLDSIIYSGFFAPGAGDIAATPDGKYAFFTAPGRGTDDPFPSFSLIIFDVQSNEIDTVIESFDYFCDSTGCAFANRLAISPDSRWLAILGGVLWIRALYLYDIEKREFVLKEDWGGVGYSFINITIQNSK